MYEKIENLEFRAGDASNLPIEKESIDLVINVESAHCYPNFLKFVQEVERVLKPGGHFMFADFLPSEEQSKLEENLNSASLGIVK